jgi:predicted SnoaL-like aldol condensation-catalyzing enzyme
MKLFRIYVAALAIISAPSFAMDSGAQLEANKKLALDFWREVIEAHNVDAAKKYYAPNLIQHNRQVGQGLSGFEETFRKFWKEPLPVKPALAHPPMAVVADGDLVQLVFKIQAPDADDKTKMRDAFEFDLFRIKDGMIVEHWDGVSG